MMDSSVENPFADLMNKAVKLKGAQQAQLRTQFDSWPQYFQHSLFMQESVLTIRTKSFPERIAAAEDMKATGNTHFNAEAYEDAVTEYEKALAVFKYLENKDPGWKKKGIEDSDMLITDFKCGDPKGQERLDALKICCYLNIAVAKFKLKEYSVAIQACGDTLALDPKNVKAYYRRALALITPASSGALEFDQAVSDLQKACAIDPNNRGVRKLLRELLDQRTKQRTFDKKTFGGMFTRGQVYEDSMEKDTKIDKAARELKFQQEVDEAEAIARGLEEKGKTVFAKEVRDKIAQAKAARTRHLKCIDFFNPTPEMVADAKESGIDLNDRKVQQMLHDLQEEERNKTSPSVSEQKEAKTPNPSAVESVDSLLKSLSSSEIAQLLSREGIDYHKITDREQVLETARQVLLSKLDTKEPTKPSHAKTIVLLAVAWTLLRLYTSGGLSILGRFISNAVTGAVDNNVREDKFIDIFGEE